jgi:hypothetical protein
VRASAFFNAAAMSSAVPRHALAAGNFRNKAAVRTV